MMNKTATSATFSKVHFYSRLFTCNC